MPAVKSFTLYALELPFRKPFKHAAKERWTSDSILLKCELEDGSIGFGECLPRDYVSGESRDDAYVLMEHCFLPRLIGQEFTTWQELVDFLTDCNGRAPACWTEPGKPQTAAWAAVDLALLDAFGHAFKQPVQLSGQTQLPNDFRYSVVFSSAEGWSYLKTLLMVRLYGFRQVKLKIGAEGSIDMVRTARKVLGSGCDIRVDVNMAWDVSSALDMMPRLAEYGVRSFEQPLMPDDIDGLAQLVRDTGLEVMVDESLNDADSLERLIKSKACTSLHVRISKCGGLIAAYDRCRRGFDEGLIIQVGCQVGESSLLSAAQLKLIAGVGERVRFGEGCFGHHLLKEDPVTPLLQFGYAGQPPCRPSGPGLGVEIDRHALPLWVKRSVLITA
jgi:muconate cycloisomerase